MITVKNAIVGFITGVLITLSWVLFLDGQIHSHDRFPPLHILPPLFATGAAVMLNLVTIEEAEENTKVKIWIFFWVTVQTVCVGSSIFILSTEYPMDDNYAGITIMLNTVFIMFAAFLFFVGRKQATDGI